jgi:hypothetical protein
LPDNLALLAGSEKIERPPATPLDVEVAIALDTATKPRLGEAALNAASKAKIAPHFPALRSDPMALSAGVFGSDSGVIQQHLVRCEEGEVVVPGGCDDDEIHGILVGVSLAVDEWLGKPGGIDSNRGSDIQ